MENDQPHRPMFAMVCANNVNRSTAAHEVLNAAGLRVCSCGASSQVAFPGPSNEPRTFGFLTPYLTMYTALKAEDAALYTDNGVLEILERNMALKEAPERWQSLNDEQLIGINVVVCLDYDMFLVVLQDIQARLQLHFKTKQLHIICLETEDTPGEALVGGKRVLDLCRELNVSVDELTEEFVKSVVKKFEKKHGRQLSYLGLHM